MREHINKVKNFGQFLNENLQDNDFMWVEMADSNLEFLSFVDNDGGEIDEANYYSSFIPGEVTEDDGKVKIENRKMYFKIDRAILDYYKETYNKPEPDKDMAFNIISNIKLHIKDEIYGRGNYLRIDSFYTKQRTNPIHTKVLYRKKEFVF